MCRKTGQNSLNNCFTLGTPYKTGANCPGSATNLRRCYYYTQYYYTQNVFEHSGLLSNVL